MPARLMVLLLASSIAPPAAARAPAGPGTGDAADTVAPDTGRRAGFIPPGFPDVVAFATNSIHVKNDSVILSGDVVANNASPGPTVAGAELVIGPKAVTSATSALKADSVRVRRHPGGR